MIGVMDLGAKVLLVMQDKCRYERNKTWQWSMEGNVYQEKHLHVSHLRSPETRGACREGVVSYHTGDAGSAILQIMTQGRRRKGTLFFSSSSTLPFLFFTEAV